MASHTLAELYADQLANSIWLELGASTKNVNNMGSTSYFKKLSADYNATFISVDIEPSDDPTIILSDAVKFCESYDFQQNLGLVYLDNFDWLWQPQEYRDNMFKHQSLNQVQRYRARGVEMNNINSSLAHFNQIQALGGSWAEHALVIMDDTWFDHNTDVFCGKGNVAVYYLLNQGWQVLNGEYSETYIVMGKNITPVGTTFDTDALNKSYGIIWKKPI